MCELCADAGNSCDGTGQCAYFDRAVDYKQVVEEVLREIDDEEYGDEYWALVYDAVEQIRAGEVVFLYNREQLKSLLRFEKMANVLFVDGMYVVSGEYVTNAVDGGGLDKST